jgi:exopolysaccharide biosynthesis polyprenyl glycosylphosphotransferase
MTLTVDTARELVRVRRVRPVTVLPAAAVAIDTAAICLSLALAALARSRIEAFDGQLATSWSFRVSAPLILAVWLAALAGLGSYRPSSFGAGTDEHRRVVHASVIAAAGVGISCFLMSLNLSRGFFVMAFLVGVPLLLLGRGTLRAAVHGARARGHWNNRVLIAGATPHVEEILKVFGRERWLGYDVVGSLVPAGRAAAERPSGPAVLGTPNEAVQLAAAADADTLFVASGAFGTAQELRRLAWKLEEEGVEVVVAPSVTDVAAERVRIRPVGGLPLIHLERSAAVRASRSAKRVFDLVSAGAAIVVLAPLLALIAVRVRRADGGPILFRQERIGRDGRPFMCLKFRTMVVDAEARLARLQAESGFTGGLFKLKDDPRVTRPGVWLRRYSLDELPQLFNILRGDMSLVGPRPPLGREVDEYDDMAQRRLRVRPGLTGLWQVSGRADLSWDESVRLDLYYVDNWSMVQDLSILRRTVSAVLASRGAY